VLNDARGQYLSVRPEVVPQTYRTELKKLQSEVPGKPFADIHKVLVESLGDAVRILSPISSSLHLSHCIRIHTLAQTLLIWI
jgi:hypothetical protein